MTGHALTPLRVPRGFWERSDVSDALQTRGTGRLFKLVQQHAGASQTQLGIAVGMTQGQVSSIIAGKSRVMVIDVLERVAEGLGMPDASRVRMGLAPRHQAHQAARHGEVSSPAGNETGELYPLNGSEAVGILTDLARADLRDHPTVTQARWRSTATPSTITCHLFGFQLTPGGDAQHEPHDLRTADAIRATARHLTALDFMFGGGHTRRTLLFYFQAEVAPLLQSPQPERLRRQLLTVAAEVTQLLGWSAYDAGRHAAAQRYFTLGLCLSREASDPLLGAVIMSNLSHQANYLGHFAEAIQLARAGRHAARAMSPTADAILRVMEARALASTGHERECAHALHRAEQIFDQRKPGSDPWWLEYFTPAELAGETAHCFRDLGKAAQTHAFATEAIDSDDAPARTRASMEVVHATGSLIACELEEAIASATRSMAGAGSLRSHRHRRYLADFQRALTTTYPRHARTKEFAERLRDTYSGARQTVAT